MLHVKHVKSLSAKGMAAVKAFSAIRQDLRSLEACKAEALSHACSVSIRLLMQGHVDMVTEKNNGVNHDFFNDPLRLKSDGTWLKVTPYAPSLLII